MDAQSNGREESIGSADSRPTIGLLAEVGRSPYHRALWQGFVAAASELDVNLLWYLCLPLNAPEQSTHCIIGHDLINAERIQGLMITGTLGNYVSAAEFESFVDFYRPIPMIGITQTPSLPSVVVNNEVGIRDVVTHLIEVHGHRRIAFICGPEGNGEAVVRYRAYVDTLTEYDIPIDPDLVAPGNFAYETGVEAVHLLLDERKADFEAIVAANDLMALGALRTLENRGIRVPDDIALAGFDDTKGAAASTPSLTTVRQPIQQLGRAGIQVMLKVLAGERVPEQTVLRTVLVPRQSCGCADPMIGRARVGLLTKTTESRESVIARREEIVSEMIQVMSDSAPTFSEWAGRLLDAFLEEVGFSSTSKADAELASSGRFLAVLADVLQQVDVAGDQLNDWQEAISVIRRCILPHISDDTALSQAEDLFNQGRAVIGKMIQKRWALQEVEVARQNSTLSNLRDELTTTVEVERLFDVLDRRLPQLGFTDFYFSLYERETHPTRWSRLMLAHDAGKRVEVGTTGRRFLTRQLVPAELFPEGRRYTWLVAPLDFGESQFGYVVLEVGPRDSEVYRMLTRQMSSSIEESLLVQQLDFRRVQMLTAAEISRAVTGMLDLRALIQQVVDLVQERFSLYYVGLFLVEGAWAVLRAATGEAGKRLLEQEHKLQVSSDSMIGQCIGSGQARIALDVGQEAVRFDNPLLPETHSELALPLVGREGAIGALTIQSMRERAFDEEDLAVFQTIADQLANAIENARLYEKIQKAYAEVEQQVQERTEELKQEQEERARLQQEVIDAQQQALRELSTPIIPVLEGVLVMPLIGSVDTMRAKDVTRKLLTGIREHRAKVVILDITGVPVVDSGVAAYLTKAIQAARLKGARTIVTGVSDAVAETIVDLGIDWSGIETLSDLRIGLQAALGMPHALQTRMRTGRNGANWVTVEGREVGIV